MTKPSRRRPGLLAKFCVAESRQTGPICPRSHAWTLANRPGVLRPRRRRIPSTSNPPQHCSTRPSVSAVNGYLPHLCAPSAMATLPPVGGLSAPSWPWTGYPEVRAAAMTAFQGRRRPPQNFASATCSANGRWGALLNSIPPPSEFLAHVSVTSMSRRPAYGVCLALRRRERCLCQGFIACVTPSGYASKGRAVSWSRWGRATGQRPSHVGNTPRCVRLRGRFTRHSNPASISAGGQGAVRSKMLLLASERRMHHGESATVIAWNSRPGGGLSAPSQPGAALAIQRTTAPTGRR